MKPNRKLWQWLGVVFVLSFAALGWLGREIYLAAPPIPEAVVTPDGAKLFTGDDVQHGQQAWLAAGGQQLGTVWGHGSYVAPDWSADWLHREAVALRDLVASEWYQSLWPTPLVRAGETEFTNASTGFRKGVPFSRLTGGRGDRVIIDDPHSTEGAESEAERATTLR